MEVEFRKRCDIAEWKEVMALEDVRKNEIKMATVEDLRVVLIKDQGDVFVYRDGVRISSIR